HVKQGDNIHRKDQLGLPGSIYSENNVIHFEIISDEANFKKIVGSRFTQSKENFLQQNGREKCCFGNIYFHLPKDTPTYKVGTGADAGKCVVTGYSLGQDLILKMRYHRGDCYMSTHTLEGLSVGMPIKDTMLDNAQTNNSTARAGKRDEYDLYDNASDLYPNNPSAGFELLRFGRILSDEVFPNNDRPPHWRKIPVFRLQPASARLANQNYVAVTNDQGVILGYVDVNANQQMQDVVWVNLNTDTIKKYSDADFPFWESWGADQSDANGDSRCDGTYIHSILNRSGSAFSSLTEAEKVKRVTTSQLKLAHTFAKFPTEWAYDDASFQACYGWMLQDQNIDGEWLKKHIKALSFWTEANIGLENTHWHFPPLRFIQTMRKCGWLSQSEFKQLLPSHIIRAHGGRDLWEQVSFSRGSNAIIDRYRVPFNKTTRKYCINTPLRLTGFFANVLPECQWFLKIEEGAGNSYWYYPWHGRGFIQLTHTYNYANYFKFRGLNTILTASQRIAWNKLQVDY
ncbi:MAG: hypothetical protein ACRCWR_01155, partial [Saezia sp.]